MPPVSAGEYLISALVEIGFVESGANGPTPVSWRELTAYGDATGEVSKPWEFRTLRAMSVAYLDGHSIGRDDFGIPPWSSTA